MKKAMEEKQGIAKSLMEYRNTPLSDIGLSPAQLMFNRRLRTRLPMLTKKLNAEIFTQEVNQKIHKHQLKQEKYFNRGTRPLQPLKINDSITVYNPRKKCWEKAVVVGVGDFRTYEYLVRLNSGVTLRRNCKELRLSYTSPQNEAEFEYEETNADANTTGVDEKVPPEEYPKEAREERREGGVVTRSGRIIKPPERLNL